MPAKRKATNKTAHVLNVITAGQDTGGNPFPAPAAESAAAAPASPSADPPVSPPATVFSSVVEVEHAPEELSDQIRKALSEELNRGENDSFSPFQPETIHMNGSAPAASVSPSASPSVSEAKPASSGCPVVPLCVSPSVDETSVSSEKAAIPQSSSPAQMRQNDESEYINIMQALVDEKAPKYIQLLGVCPCSRCLADVKALALCHLEPKYIVIQKDQKFPYSVYENYYNAAVTSQLISACRVVKENPRH